MELRLHEYTLPLKHPFKISRGTVTVQQSLIVELQQDGVSGYGEAVSSTYYNSPIETMRNHLVGMQPLLAGEHWVGLATSVRTPKRHSEVSGYDWVAKVATKSWPP